MAKTEKLFIVEVGEYFSIMISGPVTSCADPAGIIDSKTYEFQATEGGLLNYSGPTRRSIWPHGERNKTG
jgi:hypothetical protein